MVMDFTLNKSKIIYFLDMKNKSFYFKCYQIFPSGNCGLDFLGEDGHFSGQIIIFL